MEEKGETDGEHSLRKANAFSALPSRLPPLLGQKTQGVSLLDAATALYLSWSTPRKHGPQEGGANGFTLVTGSQRAEFEVGMGLNDACVHLPEAGSHVYPWVPEGLRTPGSFKEMQHSFQPLSLKEKFFVASARTME